MANKTVISDAEFKTYVEGCAPSTMGTVYMSDDSKYWMFTKEATDKIKAMCVIDNDVQLWIYNGTDWTINRIPSVIDNLTNTSTNNALSANQGKVLNEKIPSVIDNLTNTSTTSALSANQGKVLKGLIDGLIKTESKTGTTDSNGNLLLDTTGVQKRCVLFVWDGAHVFIPFYYGGKWYARAQITDAAGTAIKNTSLSVSIYYL